MDYVHSEIFSAFFGFQDMAFKSVVVDDGVSLSVYSQDSALFGVKGHAPLLLPFCQTV